MSLIALNSNCGMSIQVSEENSDNSIKRERSEIELIKDEENERDDSTDDGINEYLQ